MKSEKGMSLLSVTIYLTLILLVIGALANVSKFFYENLDLIVGDGVYASEFNKLNGFIVQDVKRNYNVEVQKFNKSMDDPNKPYVGTNEKIPVVAFKFGNGNTYIYYGNEDKGTQFSPKYKYLNQGLFKYTNQGRILKIAGGITDFSAVETKYGRKTILNIGVEVRNGKIFSCMKNPIRYTLKYW